MAPFGSLNARKHSLSNGKHRAPHPRSSSVHVSERRLADERALCIAERQEQLNQVLDRHDDLVREVFHLEKFVTMVAFDPKAAKEDKSAVFQDYKSKYDLVERITEASSSSSPSRKTRSAHTERLKHLPVDVTGSPGGAEKRRPEPSTNKTSSSNAAIWDIISSAKAKGRRGSTAADIDLQPNGDRDSDADTSSISIAREKRPSPSTHDVTDDSLPSPRKKRKLDQPPTPVPGTVKKPKKFATNGKTLHEDTHPPPSPVTVTPKAKPQRQAPTRSSTRQASQQNRLNEAVAPAPESPETPSADARSATVSTSPIRRIKLIVRKPPPTYSNPRQRPPRPLHGRSLSAYLSSYHSVDDVDVPVDAVDEMAQKEAALIDRIEEYRAQGRLRPEYAVGAAAAAVAANSANAEIPNERRGVDAWGRVVQAIVARGQYQQSQSQKWGRRNRGRYVASLIASRVQAYWDGYAARKDRARVQEEKRLRALAKSTIRSVVGEWKKAVFHIREKERLRQEAEEMRLGHEHLDAILDQSGQILETQQENLIRRDVSRSGSRSSSARDWVSDEEDGDDGSGVESDEGEGREDVEEDGEDGEMGTGDLLLMGFEGMESSRDKTPDVVDDSDSEEEQENGSVIAIDELMMTISRSSSPDQDADQDDESVSSPTTSLLLPRSPPSAESDTALVRNEADSELGGVWKPMDDESAGFEVGAKEDEPPSSDTPWSIELAEGPTSPVQPDPDAQVVVELLDPPVDIPDEQGDDEVDHEMADAEEVLIPEYLKPYAVAPVQWDFESKVRPPALLRGILRPYQQAGLEWLASLHTNNLNGILADEMGLGKTIQAISLLAHLACDRGIWGPHLIVVPTSVLLNWEMEFKKFLPGFKILSYHGSTKRRKELRQGWNDKQHFNVCITSYTLASRDAHIFKRKAWYYMILDEAHMIKNFKSQRWNILLMFRSFRRLLLTGTPLQNNLTELWALLQFLMSGSNFVNLKEFGDWFSNPLEKAIEMGTVLDDETQQRVSKLHTVLRPYLLRRLKRDVEKELPSKFEHLVLCPLSKRQRFLYDEFMSRAQTRDALQSGVYQKVANILMQLRKVCNHPDLFEVRPIVTSFAMERSAVADFEIKELLARRRMLESEEESVNLDALGLRFVQDQNKPLISAVESRRLDATTKMLPVGREVSGQTPPKDMRTIDGFKRYMAHRREVENGARWSHVAYLNGMRCRRQPVYSEDVIAVAGQLCRPLFPESVGYPRTQYLSRVDRVGSMVKSYSARAEEMGGVVDRFAFVTPSVVARDLPGIALAGHEETVLDAATRDVEFDAVLHRVSVKLQIAFPDPSLLQYDCGKLQELTRLLREKKAGGHRVLIFTQMTRILDILEIFLNFHGYLYLRLDGATKIEDRQYITERFNADSRVFCFIASSRSGGVGINLTGADTVVFYDSDFNPQMDRQCEDRAHRIGQIRDVHIYRFISQHTVEEAMLRKANQKRSLDDLVIQKGEFDWRTLFGDEAALSKALGEFEDSEDAHAAAVAAREEYALEGADEAEFGGGDGEFEGPSAAVVPGVVKADDGPAGGVRGDDDVGGGGDDRGDDRGNDAAGGEEGGEEGGSVGDYMVAFVGRDYDFFRDWRL